MTRIDDDARRERQRTGKTLYATLLQQGFTDEQIRERTHAVPSLRKFTVTVFADEHGADPVVGVAYGGDHRYEEEHGQQKIHDLLNAGKGQGLTHIVGGKLCRAYAFDVDGSVNYLAESFDERLNNGPYRDAKRRRKNGGTRVGEFHNGKVLVLLPDVDDVLSHAVLTYLFTDAADNGALRYDGTSNPFSKAAMFYDERDLSVEVMSTIRAEEEFTAAALRDVAAVKERLSKGKHLYFLGNPRVGKDSNTVFWLNSSFDHYHGADTTSYGWLTLAELESLADKIGV